MSPQNCGYCGPCAVGKYGLCETTKAFRIMRDVTTSVTHDLRASGVPAHVQRLADAKPIKLVIGSKYTGRREFNWDSRTGTYSESLPLLGWDEQLLQAALCPEQVIKRRHKSNIRQNNT